MHSVGFHRDVFTDGSPSLDNKICFSIKVENFGSSIDNVKGNGRGGGRHNEITVGLVDWSIKKGHIVVLGLIPGTVLI